MDPDGRFRSEYSGYEGEGSLNKTGAARASLVYLDSAGAAIPSQKMLAAIFADIAGAPLGNPHSSAEAQDAVNDARLQVLEHFKLSSKQYDVVFTSGATAAVKMVGEIFPFGASSTFAYPLNAHTSLLGLRCYCENALAYHPDKLFSGGADVSASLPFTTGDGSRSTDTCYSLLGTVGECNFSGAKVDLSSAAEVLFAQGASPDRAIRAGSICIKQGSGGGADLVRWLWLLDASKLVQSSPLKVHDLEPHKRPHFIALSFYKMFGYPTGLGALLLRRDAADLLRKCYFGGGTVLAASATSDFTVPRALHPHQWLEDGSCNFYAIAALKHGFAFVDRLGGIDSIQAHTTALTLHTLAEMQQLTHFNGATLCRIYSGSNFSGGAQGPMITFNVLREDSSVVGFGEVLESATRSNIVLRAGCLCNVGGCALALGTTAEESAAYFAVGRSCDSADHDVIDGKPTGAVRVSFGPSNTLAHCAAFLSFLSSFLVQQRSSVPAPPQEGKATDRSGAVVRIEQLLLYPIKSCGGMSVGRWPLAESGLRFDRAFAVVDNYSMAVLSQKRHAEMATIRPTIDADGETMTLSVAPTSSPSLEPVSFAINDDCDSGTTELVRVCGRQVGMRVVSPAANRWLSSFFRKPCTLVRYVDCRDASCATGSAVKAFSNSAEFLVVSRESLAELSRRASLMLPEAHVSAHGYDEASLVHNVRPNIVLSGGPGPHFEDDLCSIAVGDGTVLIAAGPCRRCSIVDVGVTGRRTSRVLEVLASYRRDCGSVSFGQLMRVHDAGRGNGREGVVHIETGAVARSSHPGDLCGRNGLREVS